MRYFFHIGYRGTAYNGWQRHPDALSVQQLIENALAQIFRFAVPVVGCGRTDSGVHASQFFFHADIEPEWDFDLVFRLNKALPDDIVIYDLFPMQGLPHARFDAVQRSYDYFLHTRKSPFLTGNSTFYDIPELNLDEMKKAVALLPLYQDYAAFCASPAQYEHTICRVTDAKLFASADRDRIRFYISSNRFLGKMIRIIIYRLLQIGRGKMDVAGFEDLLAMKTPAMEVMPANPQGLYLSKVTYPYLDLPPRTDFNGVASGLQEV